MKIYHWLEKDFKRRVFFAVLMTGFISTATVLLVFAASEQNTLQENIIKLLMRQDSLTSTARVQQFTNERERNDGVVSSEKGKNLKIEKRIPAWKLLLEDFQTKATFYDPEGHYIPRLLEELATTEIKNISTMRRGTQLKFWIHFVDGNQAIAKPMRDPKDLYITYDTSTSYLMERERHTAEIAAFHLDRIFDFRRVPPCTGRLLNFTSEIIMKTNDRSLLHTQTTKDGNQCFVGKCRWTFLCNESALTCAKGGLLEVSVCQAIPNLAEVKDYWYRWKTLFDRSENQLRRDCENVKKEAVFNGHNFDLDFFEAVAFDHLTVNQDRHHYKILKSNTTDAVGLSLLDNGKGFGNPLVDDPTFLLPFKICCRFRNSTYWKFKEFTKPDQMLGDQMRASLAQDPINPVLTNDFFPALDRRLSQILSELDRCIKKFGRDVVLLED
ncbi:glycosaminoglycan xylosylkinase-like [Apostichopus japonicus]|uniref:glycosaminoglycan xylosylkinase-like n=1 Tax=Stichopus japonicus TaxID=307972 RepID=UPI003AB51691